MSLVQGKVLQLQVFVKRCHRTIFLFSFTCYCSEIAGFFITFVCTSLYHRQPENQIPPLFQESDRVHRRLSVDIVSSPTVEKSITDCRCSNPYLGNHIQPPKRGLVAQTSIGFTPSGTDPEGPCSLLIYILLHWAGGQRLHSAPQKRLVQPVVIQGR